jgi:hypothetical protein
MTRSPCRTGRDLRQPDRPRPGVRPVRLRLRGSRRTAGQESRPARACVPGFGPCGGRRRGVSRSDATIRRTCPYHHPAARRGYRHAISGPIDSTARKKTYSSFRTRGHGPSPASSNRPWKLRRSAARPTGERTILRPTTCPYMQFRIGSHGRGRGSSKGSTCSGGRSSAIRLMAPLSRWRRSAAKISTSTGGRRARGEPQDGGASRSTGASGRG